MDERLVLDRYRLIERIASGGSAEVWRALDEQLDRPVAVKRLHPHLLPDPASRKRLAAEARAVAGLSHPVVVDVYDVDVEGDAPALVMELVAGESLAARIERDGPLPEREAATIAADLAEALYHAHQRGVVHRDVKAGNVLLGADGRTRLVDFGIAHSLASAAERLTLTGTVIGTLPAMAPEQLAGGRIGPRTDLYGIGVVLHHALTGRPPYSATSPLELAEAQRTGPPPLDGLDPALASIVASCLAYLPEDRPLHAGALGTALRAWLAGDTQAVTQPIPVVAVPPPSAHPLPAAATRAEPARWVRAVALALAIGALTLLAGFVVASLDDGVVPAAGSDPSPTATPIVTASPVPAWMAELLDKVAEECDPATVEQVTAELATLGEDDAKRYAESVAKECEEARKDAEEEGGGGNGNRGRGNDNGSGND